MPPRRANDYRLAWFCHEGDWMSELAAALATGLALAVAIEGALYALFPRAMKRMMTQALGQSSGNLRRAGLVAAVAGVGAVWLLRR